MRLLPALPSKGVGAPHQCPRPNLKNEVDGGGVVVTGLAETAEMVLDLVLDSEDSAELVDSEMVEG